MCLPGHICPLVINTMKWSFIALSVERDGRGGAYCSGPCAENFSPNYGSSMTCPNPHECKTCGGDGKVTAYYSCGHGYSSSHYHCSHGNNMGATQHD